MNKLIALCYFVLSLYGCDVGGSTYVHRIQVDGTDTLHSKVVVHPGIARFECVRSASGRCYYTVFPRDCALTAEASGTRIDTCRSTPAKRFAIDHGDRRQIPQLQRFLVCVSAHNRMPGPDCHAPQPIATR